MDFYSEAKAVEKDVIAWRRRIHENPELAFVEHETAAFITEKLHEFGYAPRCVGETGVVAVLEGKKGFGAAIGLRADIDALPGEECTGLPFASKKPGVMHSCGHDAHTAILLGVAKVLKQHENEIAGRIKFLFQPAEERLGGAKEFVREGELDGLDGVAALHVMTDLETGFIALRKGPALAASDRFVITVTGKSCHGAQPHRGADAILAAGHVITALQSIAARNVSPVDPVVVTIGTIQGGVASNVIPGSVVMEGTIRTLLPGTRTLVHERIRAVAEHAASALGAEASVEIIEGTPPLVCDDAWVDRLERVALRHLPREKVVHLVEPSMGGEDFAYMLQKAPGVFWRLGARARGTEKTLSHSPTFMVDEAALVHGVALTCALAVEALGEGLDM